MDEDKTTKDKWPTVQFRMGGLEQELESRAEHGSSASLVAKRDLERYYEMLRRALQTVDLSEGEALLLCDAMNGVIEEPHTIPLLWASIDDAVRLDGLDRKWNVDGKALVDKLRGLSYAQVLAVVDAVERWWAGPYEEEDRPESLRRVGLVRNA